MRFGQVIIRRGFRFPALLLVAIVVAGCALPDYHVPHGFSSTYYRQLQQSQQFTAVAPTPSEQPLPMPPIESRWRWPTLSAANQTDTTASQ